MTSLTTAAGRFFVIKPALCRDGVEKAGALLAVLALVGVLVPAWMQHAGDGERDEAGGSSPAASAMQAAGANETVASVYAGVPSYFPSDVQMKRGAGTDLTLKGVKWEADPFYFPVDGGGRVVRWSGSFGVMVDFLHNKAIAPLGYGAHGRRIKNGVVQDALTAGTLKGQPAPSPLHLPDLVDRMEFTHGHNLLMLTGVGRLAPLLPRIRPYFGLGAGVALPHVEVWFKGEPRETRTNEYQYAGSALQVLAGLELRIGRGSYYVEYKYVWSSIKAALTGGKSWSLKDLRSPWLPRWLIEPFVGLTEMPGDLWRQAKRWWRDEPPAEGTLTTRLSAHGVYVGAGYVWPAGPR